MNDVEPEPTPSPPHIGTREIRLHPVIGGKRPPLIPNQELEMIGPAISGSIAVGKLGQLNGPRMVAVITVLDDIGARLVKRRGEHLELAFIQTIDAGTDPKISNTPSCVDRTKPSVLRAVPWVPPPDLGIRSGGPLTPPKTRR